MHSPVCTSCNDAHQLRVAVVYCGVRPGSNHLAGACVYRNCYCDIQPWARAAPCSSVQVYPAYHLFRLAKLIASFGWGKGWNATFAGWQVTLCDFTWHASSRSLPNASRCTSGAARGKGGSFPPMGGRPKIM